ncbi:MAG: prolyl aminopeptidase, partial [Malacoplasma sp.]|nr:prolyl aminopeptidase [Malacoplasma sp.]
MYIEKRKYIKCDNHLIYYEVYGNSNGIPVVFLHSGPGGNISQKSLSFFDLNKYLVILFDQRGCGKSKPRFSLSDNNTDALVTDIEKIRNELNIEKWIVFGGSWGSTLSLVYSIKYPNNVIALFLRGVFLGTKKEWKWLFEEGCSNFYSEYFESFKNYVPVKFQNNKIEYYYKTLVNGSKQEKKKAAFLWSNWELINCTLELPKKLSYNFEDNYQISLLESHYAFHNSFLEDEYILKNSDKIKEIKTYIFQGRYDLVCLPVNAYNLSKKMNNCKLYFAKSSGHS